MAIEALNQHGRVALVGAISGYNGAAQQTPDLYLAATKEITLRGMLVTSYSPIFGEYITEAAGWLADGTLHTTETVYEGLDQAPAAFLGVLTGKMLSTSPDNPRAVAHQDQQALVAFPSRAMFA